MLLHESVNDEQKKYVYSHNVILGNYISKILPFLVPLRKSRIRSIAIERVQGALDSPKNLACWQFAVDI